MALRNTMTTVTKPDYTHRVFFFSHARSHGDTHFTSLASVIHQSSGVCSFLAPAETESVISGVGARLRSQARHMQRQAAGNARQSARTHTRTRDYASYV